ncbi:hypothetical protein FJ364_01985, partial [Candidatus Dependentiae bacterium]|nr:hypothetical protein [Candidatus Dependentiae bacterium]
MILPRSLMFIYAVFLTIMTGLYSRNPANLAGTYLFDSIEVKVDETSDKFSTLPLSSLNLAYGAEVFESKLAYIFYHGGDIVELDDKDRNCFYMSQDKTMEMLPSLENPFTVLTRIIFKQDPDTESLCHFKVSNTCKKFKKQANADGSFITIVDHEATIQAWAHLIAHAVSLYELSDDLQIESNSLFNFQKKLIENWKNFVAIDNT